jgi:hypothetical protein
MDEELARWVRVEAAKRDTSVSRWISEVLEERRKARDDAYQRAHESWKSWDGAILKKPGERYPTRDEMHER